MPKGGPRSRSGPAPDPDALRREYDASDWTVLPSTGRTGRVPAWPLSKATARERELWRRLWKLPQATVWEAASQQELVALYVRRFVEAEAPGSVASLSTWVRQMADSLGLTTPGMRMNRWRLAKAESVTATSSAAPRRRPQRGASARARLQIVAPDVEGA